MKLSYIRSPWSEVEYICWCGALHGDEPGAAGCDHERRRVPVVPGDTPCSACGAPRSAGRRTCGPDCVRGVDPRSPRPDVESHQVIPDSRTPSVLLILGTVWIFAVMLVLMIAANGDPGPGAPDTGPTTVVTPTSGP